MRLVPWGKEQGLSSRMGTGPRGERENNSPGEVTFSCVLQGEEGTKGKGHLRQREWPGCRGRDSRERENSGHPGDSWRAQCRVAVLEGGRNSHGSLSSGWGAGRQLLPEDISERWKMASQAWGGVWTKWPWAGLARMVRLRGLRTGRKLPRPERTDTAFLSSGQRPRTGDSPGFSAGSPESQLCQKTGD